MSQSDYQAGLSAAFRRLLMGLHDSRVLGRERAFLSIAGANPELNTEQIIELVLSDAAGVEEGSRPAASAEAIAAPEFGNLGRQDEGVATSTRTELPLSAIRADSRAQAREACDPTTIGDYREKLQEGATFPPLVVFYDGETHWLAHGFHRFEAALAADLETFPCKIHAGGLRDAILHAIGANATHGLQRTNADKRRAVTILLEDEEWGTWSDNEIARQCRVSQPFVSTLRATVTSNVISDPTPRAFRDRWGNISKMNTERIGEHAERPTEPVENLTPEPPAPHAPTEGLPNTNTIQLGNRRPLPPCGPCEDGVVAETVRGNEDLSAHSGPERRGYATALVATAEREFARVHGDGSADDHSRRAGETEAVSSDCITEAAGSTTAPDALSDERRRLSRIEGVEGRASDGQQHETGAKLMDETPRDAAMRVWEKHHLDGRADVPFSGVVALVCDVAEVLINARKELFAQQAVTPDILEAVRKAAVMANDACVLAAIVEETTPQVGVVEHDPETDRYKWSPAEQPRVDE